MYFREDPICSGEMLTTFSMIGDVGSVDFGTEPVINGAQPNPQGFKMDEWTASSIIEVVFKKN